MFLSTLLAGLFASNSAQASAHGKLRLELVAAKRCWQMAEGQVRTPLTVWPPTSAETLAAADSLRLRSLDEPPVQAQGRRVQTGAKPVGFREGEEYAGHTPLRVMAFNLLDLAVARKDNRKLRNKSDAQVLEMQRIFITQSPDIAVLPEAGSIRAIEILLGGRGSSLRETYDILISQGEGGAGRIGFLIKRSWLKETGLTVTAKELGLQSWYDPARREVVQLFHRGLPTLEFRPGPQRPGQPRQAGEPEARPSLTVIGYHGKSMRDREHDPESHLVRVRQIKALNATLARLASENGPESPVIVAGDFNVRINSAPEAGLLEQQTLSAFAAAREVTTLSDRITQVYIERGGQVHQDQLDDVRVSPALFDKLISARVERYLDPRGRLLPFPQTERENRVQPSDHLPVVVDLALPKQ